MQKPTKDARPKPEEKPANPDRIDDRWRPPVTVTEPGTSSQTYVVGKKLGKGGFAVCFEGRTQGTQELFALKVVKAKVEQKKMMEKFRTEMQIHAKMQHPNIVEFYRAFSLQDHTYVVLEMCDNGSLTDMVKARSCLSLPEVRRFMIQICGGVKYMHKRNVIHRDLKMGNIFLDANMNIKIGDFGLAAVLADEQDRRTTLCGTPNYIAPEILSKSGARGHDSKVDVWAIGIICYAMLIGIPPFQSKTQQEIYSKLKTLDYEWKVDSKNFIPQEAKDLVATCLNLVATERPEMDDLVELGFFKTGVIADVLSRECMKAKPMWLLEAEPRGDRVRGSYNGVTHSVICTESGVGKTADGISRPPAGGKGNISALVEIEAENRKGCAPVTPLPEGVLYRQFTDPEPQKAAFRKPAMSAAQPKSKKSMDEAREILSGMPSRSTAVLDRSAARPVQSFAAQQRQQAAVPRTILPSRTSPSEDKVEAETAKPKMESTGLLKARPVRSTSARSIPKASDDALPTRASARLNKLDELSDQLRRDVEDLKQPLEAQSIQTGTLRSRGIPRPKSMIQERKPEPRPVSSLSNSSSEEKQRRPLRPATANAETKKPKAVTTVSLAEVENEFAKGLVLEDFTPSLPSRRTFKPRMIEDKDKFTRVHGSSHTHVMRSLRDLHTSLGTQTSKDASPSRQPLHNSQPYPRVEKWVDYATKHGIAYLLTDGTLGMILKSRDAEPDTRAASCVVVRHAKRHTELRARGREHQYVPQGPDASEIEIYEQIDPVEPMRRLDVPSSDFHLDLEAHGSQALAASAKLNSLRGAQSQRFKEVGLLDKFGKYMHKQMGSSSDNFEPQGDKEAVGHLIHFYQRLGNVGVWRFVDGGVQFNFPDHTKIVIYQGHERFSEAEILVDVVYLEPRDAKDMAAYGLVTHEALERRDLKTFRLIDIQQTSALRRSEVEIIRTNEVQEKLDWIRAVIGCWIKEGGLGWTGEERLGWSGLQERREDKKIKLQWVTVGRPGGDGEVATK